MKGSITFDSIKKKETQILVWKTQTHLEIDLNEILLLKLITNSFSLDFLKGEIPFTWSTWDSVFSTE